MAVVIGVIVFFMKDSLSTMALLGILFITSMISITSVHGIIVHSVDIKKQMQSFQFPLLMGVVFAVVLFIWVFLIFPLFCPDFLQSFRQ